MSMPEAPITSTGRSVSMPRRSFETLRPRGVSHVLGVKDIQQPVSEPSVHELCTKLRPASKVARIRPTTPPYLRADPIRTIHASDPCAHLKGLAQHTGAPGALAMVRDFESEQDVNSPNLEQLLQIGIQSARQGNLENARVIFQQV